MRFAALFRSINVGGNSKVKMVDLRRLLSDLGLHNTATYIQSGNAVFDSDLDPGAVRETITAGFNQRFGFSSTVHVRTAAEFRALIDNLPFTNDEIKAAESRDPDIQHLYVYFIDSSPQSPLLNTLNTQYAEYGQVHPGPSEIYLLSNQRRQLDKLADLLMKSFPEATARNWRTIQKMAEML